MFLGPYVPSPFTDFFAVVTPHTRIALKDDLCGKIEMRLQNCLEAYGNQKAKEKCMDYFYDMFECHHRHIQLQRVKEIRAERKKKLKAGKIDELNSEKPPLDSYFHI